MTTRPRFLATGLIFLLLASGSLAAEQGRPALHRRTGTSRSSASRRPPIRQAEPKAKDVKSLYYEGLPFQGKPTRVFAYYGVPKLAAGKRVPAMVLVHGGGGTAFDVWVRLWNSRGYAAIAMDLCGCVPVGTYGHWQRHPAGGPPGWGGFDQIDWPVHDQWTYHAVADVLLAHSLLRSMPEVDRAADRRDRPFLGRIPDLHRGGRRPAISVRGARLWLRLSRR